MNYTIHPEDALAVDQLNRIVVSPDGKRIAFHEPGSGRLFRAWRSGGYVFAFVASRAVQP